MPKITFLEPDQSASITIEVESGTSILEASEECDAHVGSACGANLACSTCHVWVHKGYDSLSELEEEEDDILDKAFDVRAESRLGCQACVSDEDIVVEVTPESLKAWHDEHPEVRTSA